MIAAHSSRGSALAQNITRPQEIDPRTIMEVTAEEATETEEAKEIAAIDITMIDSNVEAAQVAAGVEAAETTANHKEDTHNRIKGDNTQTQAQSLGGQVLPEAQQCQRP